MIHRLIRFSAVTVVCSLAPLITLAEDSPSRAEMADAITEVIKNSAEVPPFDYVRPKPSGIKQTITPTGKQIVAWEFNTFANRLVACDEDGRVVVWSASNKQVCEIRPTKVGPGFRLAISRLGRKVLTGSAEGVVELFDSESGQRLAEYKLPAAVSSLAFSDDEKRIGAMDVGGTWFVVNVGEEPTLESFTAKSPEEKPIATGLIMIANDHWFRFVQTANSLEKEYFNGEKRNAADTIKLPFIQEAVESHHSFLLRGNDEYTIVKIRSGPVPRDVGYTKPIPVPNPVAVSAASGRNIWVLTESGIEKFDYSKGSHVQTFKLPPGVSAKDVKMYALFGNFGVNRGTSIELWNVGDGELTQHVRADSGVDLLFAEERFETIELLAKKWNGKTDHFEPREHETPYSFLMSRGQRSRIGIETFEQRNARFLKWIDENPDNCQFMRILMFRIYLATAYQARGEGFADSVTEEGWKVFGENINKAWEIVEPIFDDESVPAEAYTCAVIAGKNLQWPREEIEPYLKKSLQQYPTYHRTYAEEAVARLPRWGGAPDETAEFAEKVADQVGGDAGEILYAQLGRHIANHVSWRQVAEADGGGFSEERLMHGLVLLTQSTRDELAIQQSLLFAGLKEDEEAAKKILARFKELRLKPFSNLWPDKYPAIDAAYKAMTNGE